MPELNNKKYSKKELLKYVGDISQIGGVRNFVYSDGASKDVRACHIKTGTGFEFTVLPDRGMDISESFFNGRSLCWRSPAGDRHPAFFDDKGMGFLKSFFGGLLTTCGLTTAGAPSVDEKEELNLHGRISAASAYDLCTEGNWDDDEYIISVQGKMRQGCLFGENLELLRKITTSIGSNSFTLHDSIENQGYSAAPLMILYHINIGYPVVDDGAEWISPTKTVLPRDTIAEKGVPEARIFPGPVPDYQEQVFYHILSENVKDTVPVAMVNRNLGIGIYIKYNRTQLPELTEWKMVGEGSYVVGIEPANCRVEGRAAERKRGTLEFLEPGDIKNIEIEFGVLNGTDEIENFCRTSGKMK